MKREYLEGLSEAGMAFNTVLTYDNSLRKFDGFVDACGADIKNIDANCLIEYRDYLYSLGHASASVKLHLQVLNSFLDYLGLVRVPRGRFKKIVPRETRRNDSVLSQEEISMVKSLLLGKESHVRFCVYTMLSTGMRLSEVANLKKQYFDVRGDKLVVNIPAECTKSKRDRLVVYTDVDTLDFIMEYIYFNDDLIRISKRTIQWHVDDLSRKLGVKFSCHAFRHYFATTLLSKGVRLDIVQDLLGHKSIETTRVYAKTLISDKIDVGARVNKNDAEGFYNDY